LKKDKTKKKYNFKKIVKINLFSLVFIVGGRTLTTKDQGRRRSLDFLGVFCSALRVRKEQYLKLTFEK
jgi:hypothetical protein